MSLLEQDYIVRLIYEVIRTLLRLIFHVDIAKKNGYQFEVEYRQQQYEELTDLVRKGKINEAENRLLTRLNVYELQDLELALRFYAFLNEFDQEFLENNEFTRKEIIEGIEMVCQIYGYKRLTESLMADVKELEW